MIYKQLKKNFMGHCALAAILLASLTGCQKVALEESGYEEPTSQEGAFTILFDVGNSLQTNFSNAEAEDAESRAVTRSTPISELCDHINLMVYQDGTKVKQVNSVSTDNNFGKLSVSLNPGSYEYVILAHSCQGNPSANDIQKISFPDNKVTDTFHTYGKLTVDGSSTQNIVMDRVVAMVRFVINDKIPDNVAKMEFYYTGGSSTINGMKGYGCVNSRQTETRIVTDDMRPGKGVFEIYTIPHTDEETIKLTVKALDSEDTIIKETVLEDVPVKRNQITIERGNFFGGTSSSGESGDQSFELVTDDEWSNVEFTY